MEKSVENSPVMMEKPLDLTLEECQEAFAWLRWKLNNGYLLNGRGVKRENFFKRSKIFF